MNYLLKAYKKNFGKKVKRYSLFIGFAFSVTLFAVGQTTVSQAPEKAPVNANSLLNLNKGLQAYGFRTQDQWTKRWNDSLQPYYPGDIIPETGYPIQYMLYPYWQGRLYTSYQFRNISRIGFFGYIINPENGNPNLTYSWTVKNFVEEAKPEGTRVDLVLFCDGKNETNYFLTSEKARENCINRAVELVNKRDSLYSTGETTLFNADGINVFFPDFDFSEKREFGLFVKDLYWKFVHNDATKELIVTFPSRDTIYFNYLLGLEKYISELHFADYDYRGIITNEALMNGYQQKFEDKNSKLGIIEGLIAEMRMAKFVNPFLKNAEALEQGDNWEIYFLGICLILFVLAVSILMTFICCRFNQIVFDHLSLFTLLIFLLLTETVFLFIFMVEEMNYDIWLINTDNQWSNYFLLVPLVLVLLFPLFKLVQNKVKVP